MIHRTIYIILTVCLLLSIMDNQTAQRLIKRQQSLIQDQAETQADADEAMDKLMTADASLKADCASLVKVDTSHRLYAQVCMHATAEGCDTWARP